MDPSLLRRWWPPAAAAALLCLTALAASRSAPQVRRVEPRVDVAPTLPTYPTPAGSAPPVAAQDAAGSGVPSWVGPAVLAVLGVVLAAVAVLVVWTVVREQLRRRSRRGPAVRPQRQPVPTEDVVAALDAGLDDLSDADRDPRRAVIACWVRLEQAAAAAGTPRRPGDTPADLVGRLLREQRVSAEVLAGFAEVYREARYATHTVDDRMRAQARAALQRLRADLTAGAAP